jgi:hypothetical protein
MRERCSFDEAFVVGPPRKTPENQDTLLKHTSSHHPESYGIECNYHTVSMGTRFNA